MSQPFRLVVSAEERGHRLTAFPMEPLEALQSFGITLKFIGDASPVPADALTDADALLVHGAAVTAASVATSKRLRLIARLGVGVDNVDLRAAQARGILVTNTPDAVTDSMAQGVIAFITGLASQLIVRDKIARTGCWDARHTLGGVELAGETLGLVGLGRIGRAVARAATGLGMHVIGYAPASRPPEVVYADLDTVLEQSRFLVLACPLNRDTRYLLDASSIARMRSDAYVINVSRGGVVDQSALVAALHEGRLAGAALDVFEVEPLPADDPLLVLDNVILAPHSIGHTSSLLRRVIADACASIAFVAAGGSPPNIVEFADASTLGRGSAQ